jgi:hypothetical protein
MLQNGTNANAVNRRDSRFSRAYWRHFSGLQHAQCDYTASGRTDEVERVPLAKQHRLHRFSLARLVCIHVCQRECTPSARGATIVGAGVTKWEQEAQFLVQANMAGVRAAGQRARAL